jgi:hypothetical protein
MGLLSGIHGHASEVSVEEVQQELATSLLTGEVVEAAFRLVRDLIVFTDRRLLLVDRQGVSGKKVEVQTVPYNRIVRFAKESAGRLDLDAELRIWVQGSEQPIVKEFRKDNNIDTVYRLLGEAVLG